MAHTITIQSLASTGKGVGTIEVDGHKRPVFVPFTCPGDRVKVKITKEHKKYYEAEIVTVVKESHLRTPIRCKHFLTCGGCNLLHMDYEAQVEYKKRFLEFMFKPYYEKEIKVITGEPDFYRDKIKIFSDQGAVGFKKAKSDEVVDVEECYLINQDFIEQFDQFAKVPGEYVLTADNEGIAIWDKRDNITIKAIEEGLAPVCTYTLKGKEISYTPSCFIQANTQLNERLVEEVVSLIEKENARTVLELFSGIGNFSSQITANITCVEGDAVSYFFAKHNAPHAKNIFKDVYAYLDEEAKGQYDVVLIDPPRTGITKGYEEKLAQLTNNIIYVSCSPQDLKRNIKEFSKLGFRVDQLIFVDMFPHTHHVELICVLKN
ncbi:class I SAM-dependent RNA methyltransferase [Candidatus Woesearchaeota archaeon]|nr:MAG: class I SAM-dependent RNA methyltransferase [Candidatus Woesearchaeota archaeon]